MTPPPEPGGTSGGRRWIAVLATLATIGIVWWTMRERAPARERMIAKPPPAAPILPRGGDTGSDAAMAAARDEPPDDRDMTTGGPLEDPSTDTGRDPASAAGGVREPPPGTPEDIASTFRKLPVSAADRPPVGGIGAGGTHVDRISMGSTYVDGECRGQSQTFSVSAKDRPSVCVRVVHPREKEDIIVLWQKRGGSVRPGKMVVKPLHAYRTRAYLVLRKEDVGDWTVRIMSADGVELASHDFVVAP